MPIRADDFSTAIQRLAERRIEEAMRAGAFDNLPGKGRPVDVEPMPTDENARMVWWVMRTLRRPEPSAEELRLRGQIDALKAELASADTEHRIRALVRAINTLVRQLDAVPGGPRVRVNPVLLRDELTRFGPGPGSGNTPDAPRSAGSCINAACGEPLPPAARYCPRCGAKCKNATSDE